MGPNQFKSLQICPNKSQYVQMGPNGSKWVQNGPNESNGSKLVQIGQNGSKSGKLGPNNSIYVQTQFSTRLKSNNKNVELVDNINILGVVIIKTN